MSSYTHLLWLDLETTGTDERQDEIIEIGYILTDLELNEVGFEGSEIFRPSKDALTRLLETPVVREMHTKNGLLGECIDKGLSPSHLYSFGVGLVKGLHEHDADSHKALLAGSGVGHFDRRFLKQHLSYLDAELAYPVLDIGVVRRAWKMWTDWASPSEDWASLSERTKNHRALDDARLHLDEARAYRDLWSRFES